MRKKGSSPEVFGTSPLGYNGRDGSTEVEIPLVYDSRAGNYISKHSVVDLDNDDITIKRREKTLREETFRRKIGIK
jgi:hypothetical protein